MAEDVTAQAESSPQMFDGDVLAAITPEERQVWRNTGNLPEKFQPKKAEAASVKQEKSEAKADAEAKSDPDADTGKQQEQKQQTRRKPDAETRISQLTGEKKRLAEENEALRRQLQSSQPTKKEPESSTDKKAAESETLKRPQIKDFEDLEAYEAAKDKYFEDLAELKAKKAVEADRAVRQQEAQNQKIDNALKEAKSRYADFDDIAVPFFTNLMEDRGVNPFVIDVLGTSPVMMDMLYVLGGDEQQSAEFIEASRNDPNRALEIIFLTQKLVKETLSKGKQAASKEDKRAPTETVTRAKRPPEEVGGHLTATDDPGDAAVRSGDFRSAKAAWTRQYADAHK